MNPSSLDSLALSLRALLHPSTHEKTQAKTQAPAPAPQIDADALLSLRSHAIAAAQRSPDVHRLSEAAEAFSTGVALHTMAFGGLASCYEHHRRAQEQTREMAQSLDLSSLIQARSLRSGAPEHTPSRLSARL